MVLCNVTKWLQDGTVHVDISQCNLTSSKIKTAPSNGFRDDEHDGAMKFTIAVVLVYGIAAIGVLALGFFSRRKRHKEMIDKEAGKFVKTFDTIKQNVEKKRRVSAVTSLLQSLHSAPTDLNSNAPDRLFRNLAFLALPLTNIKEENMAEINNIEDGEELKETSFNQQDETLTEEFDGIFLKKLNSLNKNMDLYNDSSGSNVVLDSAREFSGNNLINLENRTPIVCDVIETEKDSLLKGMNEEVLTNNTHDSEETSDPDIQIVFHAGEHDTVTLDDEVFLDETGDENSLDVCTYPPRDHSPDWVDISKEKFFNDAKKYYTCWVEKLGLNVASRS